jgi:hypothetical protein
MRANRKKNAIKIVLKHAYVWSWNRFGGKIYSTKLANETSP